MGILAVDSIKSRTVAPVTVSDDLNVTGVSTVGVLTATSVVVGSGVTVNVDGVITSGIVTATTFQGNINGTTGTFSGDVSIGGTLTYEDVERVDAAGLSTFREGLNVGSPTGVGGTFNPQGDISAGIGSFSGAISGGAISGTTGTFTGAVSGTTGTFTGAVSGTTGTFTGAVSGTTGTFTGVGICTGLTVGPGLIQENFWHDPGSGAQTSVVVDVLTRGMIYHGITNAAGAFYLNLRGDGSTTFNSLMNIGQTAVFTAYTANNNASYYLNDFQIDGSSITEKWNGGSAPTAGTGSGTDVYTFNIMKTADATFSVYANFSNFA